MSRLYVKNGDIDWADVVGIVPADGWVAELSTGSKLKVMFWAVMNDGAVVGIANESTDRRRSISIGQTLRAADKVQNFSGYALEA